MDASKLSAQLRSWSSEFSSMTDEAVDVPDRLWKFIAQRLSEMGVAQEDPDVVSVNTFEGYRKVRITGTTVGGRLTYEPADGSQGMGMVPRDKVHRDDLGKLSGILERLVQEGKVRQEAK